MTVNDNAAEARIGSAQKQLLLLCDTLDGVMVGQRTLIEDLVCALFAGGHVLLEGLPGMGKTALAKGIARCIALQLNRIQCTPDLMPADITGSEVLMDTSQGSHRFDFRPGPLFGHFVLVDEINRATPRTQAAMLEAMQEQQITVLGQTYSLPQPFWVLATQNPIELEGTYPLPEAQLDRFLFKLQVEPPSRDSLLAMLDISLDTEPASAIEPVLQLEDIVRIMATAREIVIAQPLKRAAADLVHATQPNTEDSSTLASRHFRYGASPRGLQAIIRAARIKALLAGRGHVARADLVAVALPALRHRVLLNIDSQIHATDLDSLLTEHIATWARQH